jgi:tetratricopeptide (TPR) repeat protein
MGSPEKDQINAEGLGSTAESKAILEQWGSFLKYYTAIFLNDLEYAQTTLFPKIRKLNMRDINATIQSTYVFMDGLLAASFAGRSSFSRWRAKTQLRRLQTAALLCSENNLHRLYLVQAELLASSKRFDDAMIKFEKAICHSDKMPNEQVLAFEKTGRMFLSQGKYTLASQYFDDAIRLYEKWGAMVKTNQLRIEQENFGEMLAKEALERKLCQPRELCFAQSSSLRF